MVFGNRLSATQTRQNGFKWFIKHKTKEEVKCMHLLSSGWYPPACQWSGHITIAHTKSTRRNRKWGNKVNFQSGRKPNVTSSCINPCSVFRRWKALIPLRSYYRWWQPKANLKIAKKLTVWISGLLLHYGNIQDSECCVPCNEDS